MPVHLRLACSPSLHSLLPVEQQSGPFTFTGCISVPSSPWPVLPLEDPVIPTLRRCEVCRNAKATGATAVTPPHNYDAPRTYTVFLRRLFQHRPPRVSFVPLFSVVLTAQS